MGIGLHAGETVETAEGYVGSAVNVAARVCSQARAGELLVTDTVRALTRTLLPVSFVDRRSRRLKGISEPVTLYRVLGEASAAARSRAHPSGSVTGVGRTVRVAVLLVGLLIGGAAVGYLLLAAQRPPGSAASPTPSPVATFPTAEEAALVESVPLGIRETCQRTTQVPERLGTVASLRCDLGLAAEADTVWYDRFTSAQQLATAFDEIRLRERPPFADCSTTVSRGAGNWSVGSLRSGSLMCFQKGDQTWIIWTYRADRMARAVRSGANPHDWTELYAWWNTIMLFQR